VNCRPFGFPSRVAERSGAGRAPRPELTESKRSSKGGALTVRPAEGLGLDVPGVIAGVGSGRGRGPGRALEGNMSERERRAGSAIRAYERCRLELTEELTRDPSPECPAPYYDILATGPPPPPLGGGPLFPEV
jgi:hypothetical protein